MSIVSSMVLARIYRLPTVLGNRVAYIVVSMTLLVSDDVLSTHLKQNRASPSSPWRSTPSPSRGHGQTELRDKSFGVTEVPEGLVKIKAIRSGQELHFNDFVGRRQGKVVIRKGICEKRQNGTLGRKTSLYIQGEIISIGVISFVTGSRHDEVSEVFTVDQRLSCLSLDDDIDILMLNGLR